MNNKTKEKGFQQWPWVFSARNRAHTCFFHLQEMQSSKMV